MRRLDGQITVVTGASRGIGAEIARTFSDEGARVICAARTLHEGDHKLEGSLETLVSEIHARGGEAEPVVADLSQPDDCKRLIDTTIEKFGRIDVLVNNAALTHLIPVADYPAERWMKSWAINFHAPFLLSKQALAHMIPQKSGRIINVSSMAAVGPGRGPYGKRRSVAGSTCYGAEKAALERFTQGLAEEVYEHGVSVCCVAPSQVVTTPGTVFHKLVKGKDDPNAEAPSVMAQAVLLLATEPMDSVTGRVTYSQMILKEFHWRDDATGFGIKSPGSGYSHI